MAGFSFKNEFLDEYLSVISSRIVSKTGISSDKYHLGKIILQSLKDDPDFVLQIDGGTGESETNGSVLRRSIKCATIFRNMGLKMGDVIVLMAPHHLNQAIPFYAALYLGIIIAPIDRMHTDYELKHILDVEKPKMIICQSEKVQDIREAVDFLGLDPHIISFDKSPVSNVLSFSDIMKEISDSVDVHNFEAADFDSEETIAFLVSTSGTTGLPKAVTLTHKNIAICGPNLCACFKNFPRPTKAVFLVTPLEWMTAVIHYVITPYLKYTRIQTSLTLTTEHIVDLIKKYEPTFLTISPTIMITLLKLAAKEDCDFSSFEVIYMAGNNVPPQLIKDLRSLTPNTEVNSSYVLSEVGANAFHPTGCPLGSLGKRLSHIQYKLVDIETGEEIKEHNKNGELWVKLPIKFKGYYSNPEATAEVLSKDKWIMTGDVMYRDEDWNYYFVERIKHLLKYKTNSISPAELESVIRLHPGVLDVAVTGIPDAECGDLPIACVVSHPGATVTAEEIENLVKETLSDWKRLRGGVIFLKELPLTASTKLNRRKLKEMVIARTKTVSKKV